MPTTAGSDLDLADLIEPEGSFVKALKRAGCVILGKTRTTEFAAGTFNLIHRTSWNPWDTTMQRMPGGSSSGSAVALAAKLCAFSIGSDTGGSVRQPAALCGVFGYKATSGMWPMNGIFPLSPTLDSIGIFTAGAEDGALVFSTLADRPVPVARPLRGLRLGKPVKHFFDDLEAEISAGIDRALAMLRRAGVEFVPIDFPEAAEIKDTFGRMVPAELLAFLGRERFLSSRDRIDPVVRARLDDALDVTATNYIQLVRRHVALRGLVKRKMNGLDALITPTTPVLPMPVAECTTVEAAIAWNRRSLRNTQPVNLFGLCGISIPIQASDAALPVGLQIVCEPGADEKLFSIALAVEEIARSA